MNDYELSVIIPSRNEEWLNRTIQDILEHKKAKTQIIVGLDGQWPVEPIKNHPDVVVLFFPESIGQRAITNQCVNLSRAKYIMKLDAHCALDDGFDQKMIEAFAKVGDDVVMAPIMRNLHIFNWKCPDGHIRYQGPSGPCKECGKETVKDVVWNPKTNPSSTSYCFDPEPHFQYFNEIKNRESYKNQGDMTESMSLQGSCFMLTRALYWELNICDEAFGTWGSQGIEVACKFWLSGRKVLINHNTWYAHCFRTQGGDFGFPYELSGNQVSHAKKLAKDMFFGEQWVGLKKPLWWLVEKFWPVPGWKQEDLDKLKGVGGPTKGILYYTDNQLNMKLAGTCRKQIAKSGLPITSVSLKKMNFGNNIHFKGQRGYLTMAKQILAGLEAMTEDIVYFCEHDVLYHPDHFKFTPPEKETWYYNGNYWFLRQSDGFAIHYDASPLSGLVVYRSSAIKHFRERIKYMEEQGENLKMLHVGFEPFTHGRVKWNYWCPFEVFMPENPNIDITHTNNTTWKRWNIKDFIRKPKFWEESTINNIKGWDNVRGLLG